MGSKSLIYYRINCGFSLMFALSRRRSLRFSELPWSGKNDVEIGLSAAFGPCGESASSLAASDVADELPRGMIFVSRRIDIRAALPVIFFGCALRAARSTLQNGNISMNHRTHAKTLESGAHG